MIQRLAILSGLMLSVTCGTLPHSIQVPVLLQLQPLETQQNQHSDDSNYSFAYNVNDENTGDIKSQQESKYGDTITGQYSLIQPDGIKRTVDYHADDHRGFRAQVNNEKNRHLEDPRIDSRNTVSWPQNDQDLTSQWPQSDGQQWPQKTQTVAQQWSPNPQNVAKQWAQNTHNLKWSPDPENVPQQWSQNGSPQWQQNIPNSPAPWPQSGGTVIAQWQQTIPSDALQWQPNSPDLIPQRPQLPQLTQWQSTSDLTLQKPQLPQWQPTSDLIPQRPQIPQLQTQWQSGTPDLTQQKPQLPQLTQNSQNASPQWPTNSQDAENVTPSLGAVSKTSIVQTIQTSQIAHPSPKPQTHQHWE